MVFVKEQSYTKAFDLFLEILLKHTKSEYGFIGEVRHDSDGNPYLKTFAITNIAWNDETRKFYSDNAPKGLEFYNLNSLFGRTLATSEIVMTNDPSNHKYSAGIPNGHPPLNAYLGMPLIFNDKMIGMFGVANKPDGYNLSDVDGLKPLNDSISTFIYGYQKARQEKLGCHNVTCSNFPPKKDIRYE